MKTFYRFAYFFNFFCLSFFLSITFTSSYASTVKKIRYGVPQYKPPLSFMEKNNKGSKGFCVDLAESLSDRMNLQSEIFAMEDSLLIAALNEGKIDIAIGIMDNSYSSANIIKTSVNANRSFFINKHYSNIDPSINLDRYVVAIEKGNALSWFLSPTKEINFLESDSQEEALACVDSGKAMVYISADSGSTRYIIEKMGLRNIEQFELPIETVPLVLAVRKNDMDLFASLSIAYGKILEDGKYQKIYYKWLNRNSSLVIPKYKNHIIVAAFCIIFVFLSFIIWNFFLKKEIIKFKKKFLISEQKYRDLIESSPDMIHLVSRDGEIKLSNKIAKKYLGYNEKEMITLKLQDLMISKHSENVTVFLDDVFMNKYSNKEFTFFSKNGDKIDVEMVAAILKDDESRENLACCFSRDLTYRKRLEEELIHSDRLAVLGQMAAGIAHEINSPLWVILSNAKDAIAHDLDKEELRECLEAIDRSGTRAAKFIEGMLTFARPTPMKFIAIDLVNLIKDSLVILKQKLKTKNIRVEEIYFSDSVLINGDESSIQQLVFNIILNAIQAIHKNGLITISIGVTEENGKRITILEVMDNGSGIPDEHLQSVFNPFFTSGKSNGFGLGLFMSKMIVEKHHGSLSAKSQLGEGTTITACFPEIPVLSIGLNT